MCDATSLYHCLKNKQLKLKTFSGKDPAKEVFNIMHRPDNKQNHCGLGKNMNVMSSALEEFFQ